MPNATTTERLEDMFRLALELSVGCVVVGMLVGGVCAATGWGYTRAAKAELAILRRTVLRLCALCRMVEEKASSPESVRPRKN